MPRERYCSPAIPFPEENSLSRFRVDQFQWETRVSHKEKEKAGGCFKINQDSIRLQMASMIAEKILGCLRDAGLLGRISCILRGRLGRNKFTFQVVHLIVNTLHALIQQRYIRGGLHQFIGDAGRYGGNGLVAQLMLQCGPEVHGDGANLHFHGHEQFSHGQVNGYLNNQVQAAVAVFLRFGGYSPAVRIKRTSSSWSKGAQRYIYHPSRNR